MENFGIGSWLQRRRPKSGTKTAVIAGDRELSYVQLAERSTRLANALRDRGVAKGDRVAYLGENDPSFLETLFAAGLAGRGLRPAEHPARPARNPVPAPGQRRGPAGPLGGARGARGTRLGGDRGGFADRRRGFNGARHDSARGADGGTAGGTAVEAFEAVIASGAALPPDEPVGLDDAAMILYTSGTTGNPKGALLTHGNITWNCVNVLVDYDFACTDVALMISPMFHVASLDMGVLPTLLKGGTVVLEAKFDPRRTLELIEQHRATTISGVPTTYQMLCEHPDWDSTDLSSLNKLTCGGSAVPMRVLEAYEARGLRFSNGYGMTETAPGATSCRRPGPGTRPARRGCRTSSPTSGSPIPWTRRRARRAGKVGEIQIKGPTSSAEYWNRPEASADSFADGGWFKSGDMGYMDADGFLFISDRLKDMIISGGENIYPAEVEQAIIRARRRRQRRGDRRAGREVGRGAAGRGAAAGGGPAHGRAAALPPGGQARPVQDPQVRGLRGRDAPDGERQDPQGGPEEADARPRLTGAGTHPARAERCTRKGRGLR